MDTLQAEGISTFLVDAVEYNDLTRRARLADLLVERITTLEDRLSKLEDFTASRIGEDRKRLTALERVDLQPKQLDRSEILLALLRDNNGKMFAKEARRKMGLGKATFSVLLKSLKDEIDKKPYHLNKRQLVISLR